MKAGESRRHNMRLLSRFLLTLTGMVIVFTIVFHTLMAWEGQEHSWLTGFYWSFTVMSTLGFGDITFQSDIGRIFSICQWLFSYPQVEEYQNLSIFFGRGAQNLMFLREELDAAVEKNNFEQIVYTWYNWFP